MNDEYANGFKKYFLQKYPGRAAIIEEIMKSYSIFVVENILENFYDEYIWLQKNKEVGLWERTWYGWRRTLKPRFQNGGIYITNDEFLFLNEKRVKLYNWYSSLLLNRR